MRRARGAHIRGVMHKSPHFSSSSLALGCNMENRRRRWIVHLMAQKSLSKLFGAIERLRPKYDPRPLLFTAGSRPRW